MRKLLALFTAVIILTACSSDDDPVTPTPGHDGYFTANVGKTWVYQNTSIDSNGTATTLDKFDDTLTFAKDTNYLAQPSKWMRHHFVEPMTNNVTNGNYALYESSTSLFISSEFLKLFLPSMLSEVPSLGILPQAYYKIADVNTASWTIDSFHIADFKLPAATEVILAGDLKASITRKSDSTINGISGVHVYTMTMLMVGTATAEIPILGLTPIPISAALTEVDFYLKDGNGLIGIYNKPLPVKVSVPMIGDMVIANQPGYRKMLK
ncbi:MAG: hypothetical protein LBO69_00545 [Ignavibacteria bacterium]|jgi:hypothetical protein|nr:hypothetical protein [Ignavibacteria bacterium]